jgi:hypothetical protein
MPPRTSGRWPGRSRGRPCPPTTRAHPPGSAPGHSRVGEASGVAATTGSSGIGGLPWATCAGPGRTLDLPSDPWAGRSVELGTGRCRRPASIASQLRGQPQESPSHAGDHGTRRSAFTTSPASGAGIARSVHCGSTNFTISAGFFPGRRDADIRAPPSKASGAFRTGSWPRLNKARAACCVRVLARSGRKKETMGGFSRC